MSADPLLGEVAPATGGAGLSGPGVTPPSLSGAGRRFLSDILVELGFVDETQAARAVEAARNPGQTPEKVLLESGTISEDQLARALAERYSLDHIDLGGFPVDPSAAGLLRRTAAKRYLAAPVGFADDGALVLAVADPGDSLGLSDIAVMTKLPVRPAVAARSQIGALLDTLSFMEEPVAGASQPLSTVLVPPEDDPAADPPRAEAPNGSAPEASARLAAQGEQAEAAALREREEALAALRQEHERELASAEAAADEALRAERGSAQQALSSLRAKHEEALEAERAKRVEEVEAERERTAAALEAERDRNARELEALRARLTEELEAARADAAAARDQAVDAERVAALESELAAAREQVELSADADRRAEAARAALAALRDESERQAQLHALTERELRAELEDVRGELESLQARLAEPSKK